MIPLNLPSFHVEWCIKNYIFKILISKINFSRTISFINVMLNIKILQDTHTNNELFSVKYLARGTIIV